jgi:hypothetical protein
MDRKSLEKFFTLMVTKKFPFVKKVEVFERTEFDFIERNVWVFLNKYEDIRHDEEIKDYIEELSKYTTTKITVVKFTLDSNN